MALEIISRFLWRAPLLPVRDLSRAPRSIFGEALPVLALRLAQPDLARAIEPANEPANKNDKADLKAKKKTAAQRRETGGEKRVKAGGDAARALANYARRAAFRATPHGLWAGAGAGTLAARTRGRSGAMHAALTVSFARLQSLARARLDDAEWQKRVKLRVSPSLVRDRQRAMWLAPGAGAQSEARQAELDATLTALLDAAADWTPFAELAQHADDDFVLLLVDDGLLISDLVPPLVGPPPLSWLAARDASLAPVADALAALDVDEARALLRELPGAGDGEALHSVLVHDGEFTLSRVAVTRAAALAPLLFRVQEALSPPAAERALDPAIATALAGVTATFGAGAFALDALALGHYGTALDIPADDSTRPPPNALLVALLADAIVAAARAGEVEVALDAAALDRLAPSLPTPPTFELMVTPAREPKNAPPGTDWLLGLHAPAGASWGRFGHALGAPLAAAFAELAAREPEGSCDVAYAPSSELGDLTAHPPARATTLALTSWPAGADTLTPEDLALVADEAGALTLAGDGKSIAPAPAWRVRSTTAPRGLYRLLTGFSLYRQYAPWALSLGPLANLAWTPRFSLDGFVVAPQSWRIPPLADRRALARWRREATLPRLIQVGHEDELLLLDLDDAHAIETLRRLPEGDERPRAFEIWPPLDALVDEGGRRIEAIVAVVDRDARRASLESLAASSRLVPPPSESRAPAWQTFKLFGPADRAEPLLATVIAPLIDELRAENQLLAWFFLPFVDGPGHRDHLRLRLQLRDGDAAAARLDELLEPARSDGSVATVERADYHRELARYGADAMSAVERAFESDSELVLALLDSVDQESSSSDDIEADLVETMVSSYDALATGAGLDLAARAVLAGRRRDAFGLDNSGDDPWALEFRRRQPRLRRRLAHPSAPFAQHSARIQDALGDLPLSRREELLPALLHLAAVRLGGPDRAPESAAIYLWQRTLESLLRHAER